MKWPYINLKNTSLYKLIHFILSKYFKFEGKSCYSHWELSCTQGNWILRIRFFFGGGTEEKILQFSSFTFVHLQRTQLIVYQTVWHLFDMETDFALQLDLILRVGMMIIMLIHPTFLSIRYVDMIWIVKKTCRYGEVWHIKQAVIIIRNSTGEWLSPPDNRD